MHRYDKYKVIGLQRTGTNWLNELIQHNFVVDEDNTFWKHLTPLGVKQKRKNFWGGLYSSYTLELDPNTFYIATSKDFDLWQDSLLRNKADTFKTHKVKGYNTSKKIHNSWMIWARSQANKENFFCKDYIDWLVNWKLYFEEIANITGWKRKNLEFNDVKNVPWNDNFNKKNYL